MLIDSHAHVDFGHFDKDREVVLDRARNSGIDRILNPGVDPGSSLRAVKLARAHPGVIFPAAGIHPLNARGNPMEAMKVLADVLEEPEIIALGETGIDLFKKYNPEDEQRAYMAAQVRMALDRDLPVILHCREAFRETLEVLRGEGVERMRGVMHCFSGTLKDAEPFVELGFHLGIACHITYPGSTELREAVARLPLERLLVETDSPYLAPQKQRGRRNEPENVRTSAEMIAALKGIAFEEVARSTTENVVTLFDRMK